jgi:general secretion pathway protein G
MRFEKRSRKIRIKKRQREKVSLTFVLYLSIGIGVLTVFFFMVFKGHERQLRRLRQEKVKADMDTLASALFLYFQANDAYPSKEKGLNALLEEPRTTEGHEGSQPAPYLQRLPRDPWDHPYVYETDATSASFDLVSLGADGRLGGSGESADIHWKK